MSCIIHVCKLNTTVHMLNLYTHFNVTHQIYYVTLEKTGKHITYHARLVIHII
jgi:hypothetical protein